MISFCADAIGIRDDMFLGAGNAYMREVGAALDEGFKEGVLNQDDLRKYNYVLKADRK